jgi:hypothetical protein
MVEDLAASADALIARAALRVEATATAALKAGDVDGAYIAAYDAYRMAAESLLVRQGLRATGVVEGRLAEANGLGESPGTSAGADAHLPCRTSRPTGQRH